MMNIINLISNTTRFGPKFKHMLYLIPLSEKNRTTKYNYRMVLKEEVVKLKMHQYKRLCDYERMFACTHFHFIYFNPSCNK